VKVTGLLKKNAEEHLSTLTASVSVSSSSSHATGLTSVPGPTTVSASKMTPEELEKVHLALLCFALTLLLISLCNRHNQLDTTYK